MIDHSLAGYHALAPKVRAMVLTCVQDAGGLGATLRELIRIKQPAAARIYIQADTCPRGRLERADGEIST